MEENKNSTNENKQQDNWDIFGGAKRSDEVTKTNNVGFNDIIANSKQETNLNSNLTSSNESEEVIKQKDETIVEKVKSNHEQNQNNNNVESKTIIVKENTSNLKENGIKENTEIAVPKYEEVEIKKEAKAIRNDSYFDGKLLDLLGWMLLKNIIKIFTLGIMGPWGDCMMLEFEIGHTTLNGKRLKFKGTGGSLFVERFKDFSNNYNFRNIFFLDTSKKDQMDFV